MSHIDSPAALDTHALGAVAHATGRSVQAGNNAQNGWLDADLPDGSTLANHRPDGHGGATHDVLVDGRVVGVRTSGRRDSTGIWIPSRYWPSAEPAATVAPAVRGAW